MTNKLQQYFPMIQSRKEILFQINQQKKLQTTFDNWLPSQQELFLDFCSGVRGVKILYDFMFKEILNPETVPERLNDLLSLIMAQKVSVLSVLPNDSTRIADESSLLITDIVVQMEDGSIANLEIQKIGYKFPGQRCSCYSSDLLLRQYKRVRSIKKKRFTYKDIKNVYTIILFEKSPAEFHTYPDTYLHHFSQKSDTGLELELLQKYVFIPLDIFSKSLQNKGINNRLEAWLAFLSSDDPEIIISLIESYADFRPLYEHVYDICRNIEEVMGMFSKELQELDRNTVQYMIDEMQEELNQKNARLDQQALQLNQQATLLREKELAYQKALEHIAELERTRK